MRLIFQESLQSTPVQTREGRRLQIQGEASIGKVLACEFSKVASPTGFATLLRSEELAESWALSLVLVA